MKIINKEKSNKSNILIHCMAGKSGSASIVIYYLMNLGYSYDGALMIVKKARPIIQPNDNFIKQLKSVSNTIR